MRVFFQQQCYAQVLRDAKLNTRASAHLIDQRLGHAQGADALAFRLDKDGARRIKTAQRMPDCALETFLIGLRLIGQRPQQRAAMQGQFFQIEHLPAQARQ